MSEFEQIPGFPPGFGVRRETNEPERKEAQRQARHSEAVGAIAVAGVPLEGRQPVVFDSYGSPQIDDAPTNTTVPTELLQPPRPAVTQPNNPQSASTFMSSQRSAQPQTRRVEAVGAYQAPNYTHPIAQKLMEKFGLRKAKRHTLIIEDAEGGVTTFVMSMISEELQMWAIQKAEDHSRYDGDQSSVAWFQSLVASMAVLAIDNTPAWQVFEVEVTEEEKRDLKIDPLDVTPRIRKASGEAMAQMFFRDTFPMMDKVVDFYNTKVIKGVSVSTNLDKENAQQVRYNCPIDGCDHHLWETPIIVEGSERPFFCKFHGVQLVAVANLSTEVSRPLG
jgi:hypothetical protein